MSRPQAQQRRNGDAERSGGLEIDQEIELGRLLNREICDLRALQYPVDVPPAAARCSWGAFAV